MLDPRPQFDTYAPQQGEVAALRFEAAWNQQEYRAGGGGGSIGAEGRWETPPRGRGPERCVRVPAPPQPGPGPRPAHTDSLKGPHTPVLRGLQHWAGAPSIPQGFQGKTLM